MPKASRRPELRIAITGRGVDNDLRDTTDRAIRFALARFAPAVRRVRVRYAHRVDDLAGCTVAVDLVASRRLVARQRATNVHRALRATITHVTLQIARELRA